MEAEALDLEALAEAAVTAFDAASPGLIAVDTETTGFEFFDTPFCVTVAWRKENEDIESHFLDLSVEAGRAAAALILDGGARWAFFNAKFDLQKLILAGIIKREDVSVDQFEDGLLVAALVDEHRRNGLKPLMRDLLGKETDEEEALAAVRRKLKLRKDDGYHLLPREVLMPYALKDAEFTLELLPILARQLDAVGDPGLWDTYQFDKELILTLLDMEAAGVRVDKEYVESTAREYGRKAIELEMDIRDLTGDEDFNPNSNPQIRAAFEARGIEAEKYDKSVLSKLEDPLAKAILDLRHVKKMHGTYLVAILNESRDSILHPNYRYPNTRTGRLASGGAEES